MAVPITNSDASYLTQLIGAASIFAWVFTMSFIVWLLLKFVIGIRVAKEDEFKGLDFVDCGLEAYPEFTDSSK